MQNFPIPRLDEHLELRAALLKYCRLQKGEFWQDPVGNHRIGCCDATNSEEIKELMEGEKAVLALHDPPYNLVAFEQREINKFISWCTETSQVM